MSLVKQWICLKWLYWLPQNSENCNRICNSLWKIQQFPHWTIQSGTHSLKVRGHICYLQTPGRQLTSLSPSLHSGLAQSRQTSLSHSPNSVSEGRGKIMEAVINHGIRNGKQGKPPSGHEQCKAMLPLLTKQEGCSFAAWEALIWFLFNFYVFLAFLSWVASG